MKFGDISNQPVPAIGIRFEGVIYLEGVLNRAGKAFIDDLFLKDLNVYLISLRNERKVKAFCYKWDVYYNKVLEAENAFEIPALCEEHHLLAYFDTDDKILQSIGNRGSTRTEPRLWTARETR